MASKHANLPVNSALSFSSPLRETGKEQTEVAVEKWAVLLDFATVLPLFPQLVGFYQNSKTLQSNFSTFSTESIKRVIFLL